MKFNVRGSKLEVTDAIKAYVEKRLGKLDKYFENSNELTATVLIKLRGNEQVVEVTIPIKKIILRAEDSNKDLYSAIDLVVEKLERQIRKNKTRLHNRKKNEKIIEFNLDSIDEIEEDSSIIKRKKIDAKPMNEEEALLQMDLLGHDFFAFKNVDTNSISIVYKRKDGNYGIIEM
ncbi:MAG: ribosome-associated translation inhibitor RaiA [Bacilli bacterium]|nr:ribosome-associated translation inhibitor RaiA [Bacilli bacterium]